MVAVLDEARRSRQARGIGCLTGRKLENVWLGDVVVLGFSGGCQVLIETSAQLAGPDGRAVVEPGEDPSDALAAVLGDVVTGARTGAAGELRICFGNRTELLVDAAADRESWAFTGPDGFLIVCLPRGELAVWR